MVRTRFAPSPTGMLHIGALRTALFSYLLAKHHGGQFILRIEDTDRARSIKGSVQQIVESLRWVGIEPDAGPSHGSLQLLGEDFSGAWADDAGHGIPGPFVQSERLHLYRAHAERLIAEGKAYRCDETTEELDAMRKQAEADKRAFSFRKEMRLRTEVDPGSRHVIRLAMPREGGVTLHDLVLGDVTFEYANVDDPILVKGDPERSSTYHLAAMYDDWAMGITHIVRSTEWMSSAPKHLWLFEASGWPLPQIAHVPNVNGNDGKKLSKRKGAPSMFDFRDKGYVPEAVLNQMALLGWNPGSGSEQNVFTHDELVTQFSMNGVGSSSAVFETTKLDWLNAQHLRAMSDDALIARLMPTLTQAGIMLEDAHAMAKFRLLLPSLRPRLNLLGDVAPWVDFVFNDIATPPLDMLIGPKMDQAASHQALLLARAMLDQHPFADEAGIEAELKALLEELKLKPNQLFTIVRNAISGKSVTPPLYATLLAMGKPLTLMRLDRALAVLHPQS